MLANVLLVGVGGFIGSVFRYLLGSGVQSLLGESSFPFGTLVVNVLGCLIIGILAGLSDFRQVFAPEAQTFLLVGLLGGFTTFSAFGYETITLLRDGETMAGLANVMGQVAAGLAAVWIGYRLSQLA